MSRKRRKPDAEPPLEALSQAEAGDQQVRALLHELQVHSEEITVQNEQLVRAQTELEETRDRYADLYDFAPVGFLTVDSHGVIKDINLAATSLLERTRTFLLSVPLVNLIEKSSREALRRLLLTRGGQSDTIVEVGLRTKSHRVARLIIRPMQSRTGSHLQFIAMLDVTTEKQLAAEKAALFEREQIRGAELAAEVATRLAAEERAKALLERLVTVQEQERRRLALNLHDHLGQQLTALRLSLSALRDERGDEGRHRKFELIDQLVSQLDRDVDFLAWELRPAALDDVGLEAALSEFVRQWSAANGVVAEFHHSSARDSRLPSEVESNLYRIVQESLNNVSKHAHANHVSVLLERREDEATLIVEDDGRGFEPARDALHGSGMGLAGMRERAAFIGGHCEIETSPGKGTTLFLRIPLHAAQPQNPPEITQK